MKEHNTTCSTIWRLETFDDEWPKAFKYEDLTFERSDLRSAKTAGEMVVNAAPIFEDEELDQTDGASSSFSENVTREDQSESSIRSSGSGSALPSERSTQRVSWHSANFQSSKATSEQAPGSEQSRMSEFKLSGIFSQMTLKSLKASLKVETTKEAFDCLKLGITTFTPQLTRLKFPMLRDGLIVKEGLLCWRVGESCTFATMVCSPQ